MSMSDASARLQASTPPLAFLSAEAVAEFVVAGRVDERAREMAVSAVLDTVAATLGGVGEPAVTKLLGAMERAVGDDTAEMLWSDLRLRRTDAALVTGTAAHVLDYDDVSMLSVCHPSAPILSALLSARRLNGLSGVELLDAFVIGAEILIRLGQTMGFRHYQLGFHATSTLGAVGAAAACARLLGADVATTGNALSIAASMSSGLQVNFGSMVKSLHVGLAASNGVRAVQLALAGVEGAAEPFSGAGFIHAFSGGESRTWPASIRLGAPFAIVEPGFEQKRYPCCYMLHRMAEASLRLRREHGITLDDVAGATVDMPFGGTRPLVHPRPRTGLNALFSGPYAVAASLADGRLALSSFTDEQVLRPQIQRRLGDVEIVERALSSPAEAIGDAPVAVTLRLRNGEICKTTVVTSPGSLENPLTLEQLRGKWIDCLSRTLHPAEDEALGSLFDEGRRLLSLPDVGRWAAGIRSAFGSHQQESPR